MERENRRRYYVAYGGRGSAKSWSFARAAILQSIEQPLRVLCAREIQRTIADSVHRLLADQIQNLNAGAYFEVLDASITGINKAEFLYTGLRGIDAAKIKSFEGVDLTWCEEAQAISKKSWEILIPTIRAEQSEIWATFNPDLEDDDTYQRFVVRPPENAWVQRVTWADNPWFPAVLEAERLALKKRDPAEYEHVWEGRPRTVVPGAIYAGEVMRLVEEGRYRPVPYDPRLPVHTIWDLGWNDAMTIVMVQVLPSAVMVIDYIEDSFRTYADYVVELKRMPYVWGTDYLPHDGEAKDPKSGKSARQVLHGLGRTVEIIPKLDVESGIRAVRMLLPRVYFHNAERRHEGTGFRGCERLLTCLKRYRRAVPESSGEPSTPVHDQYSHGADAIRGLAMIVDKIKNTRARPAPRAEEFRPFDAGAGY